MATGPVNSQAMNPVEAAKARVEAQLRDAEAQALAAAGTLRTGETQSSTEAALKDPNSKTYMHMVPGARFIMPNGLELRFLGGMLCTNDPAIISELDKIADKSSSQIYTKRQAKIAAAELQQLSAVDASHDQAPKKS